MAIADCRNAAGARVTAYWVPLAGGTAAHVAVQVEDDAPVTAFTLTYEPSLWLWADGGRLWLAYLNASYGWVRWYSDTLGLSWVLLV